MFGNSFLSSVQPWDRCIALSRLGIRLAIGLVLLVCLLRNLDAQSGDSSSRSADRAAVLESPPPDFQKHSSLPDAVYLRNEKGAPIFIPRARYEDFEQYLDQRSGSSANSVPTAILESTSVQGTVRNELAEFKISLVMTVTDPDAAVVRLPLNLAGLQLTAPPKTVGGKRSLIVISDSSSEMVWWLEPDGSKKYRAELKAVSRVEQTPAESSIRFELPTSAVTIDVEIPNNPTALRWSGATGEVIESKAKTRTCGQSFADAEASGR